MKRFTLSAFAFLFALGGSSSAATFAQMQASYELMIGGVSCGTVKSISGGELVATIATNASTGKKNIAASGYTPIKVALTLPLAAPVVTFLREALANQKPVRALQFARYDVTDKLVETLDAGGARLAEFRLPLAAAAGLGNPSFAGTSLTLVFVVESLAPGVRNNSPLLVNVVTRPNGTNPYQGPTLGGIRFAVTGLPAFQPVFNAVAIKPAYTPLGNGSAAAGSSGSAELPNLLLGFTNNTAFPSWAAWRDEFISQGLNDDAHEKTATLEFLSENLSKVLLSVQFSHVGLVRFGGNDTNLLTEAELYYESVTAQAGAADPSAPIKLDQLLGNPPKQIAANNSGLASSAAAATAASSAPGTVSAVTPASAGNGIATTSSAGNPAVKDPVAGSASKVAGDRGAHDITDFVRPDEVVRKAYSIDREKTKTRESASYTGTLALEAAADFYAKNLSAAGWTETSRTENNEALGHLPQVVMNWTKPSRTALIIINDVAGGTIAINVTVFTTLK